MDSSIINNKKVSIFIGSEVIGFLGVKVPVIPGARAKMAVPELESGRYALICFLPDTSVPGEEQPPHFVLGMVSEFEVE